MGAHKSGKLLQGWSVGGVAVLPRLAHFAVQPW